MTATKKTPVRYDPNAPITPFQKKRILHNCNYNMEIKDEWVQWVTGDVNQTSLKSLTQLQAVKIICQQTGEAQPELKTENWGLFDKNNSQHRNILSLMRQAQWVKQSEKWGEVADLERLSNFLKSDKSPVKKPLKKMTTEEVSKIITALEGIVKSRYK